MKNKLLSDINQQYNKFYSDLESDLENEFKSTFQKVFVLNYMTNRIEIKKLFEYDTYINSYSCILEAFDLIQNNYINASQLCLRSGIESYNKFIIESYNRTLKSNMYAVDKWRFSKNRKTIDKIIAVNINVKYKKKLLIINKNMKNYYDHFSKITHPQINYYTVNGYLTDLKTKNKSEIINILELLNSIVKDIITVNMIISESSIREWVSNDLKDILYFAFDEKEINEIISLIKKK